MEWASGPHTVGREENTALLQVGNVRCTHKSQSSKFEQKHPLLQPSPLDPTCSSPTFIFLLLPHKNHPDSHVIGTYMKNITSDVYFSRIHIKKKKKSWILSQQRELGYTLYWGSELPEHLVMNQTGRYGAKGQKVLQMKHKSHPFKATPKRKMPWGRMSWIILAASFSFLQWFLDDFSILPSTSNSLLRTQGLNLLPTHCFLVLVLDSQGRPCSGLH